ncbi:MAG TPA: hypothetical protein VFI11_13910 [Anaerolineales bacterium]|nr:hypothetical protein [Anaerolineales bacterium]
MTKQLRLLLMKDEVFRVPSEFGRLKVRSGHAWLTMAGQDLTLVRGQEVDLESKAGKPVVSTAGRLPVVVELIAASRPQD